MAVGALQRCRRVAMHQLSCMIGPDRSGALNPDASRSITSPSIIRGLMQAGPIEHAWTDTVEHNAPGDEWLANEDSAAGTSKRRSA
eukprot:2387575-Amphidinium_carterae.1